MTVEDDVSLSPQYAMGAHSGAPALDEVGAGTAGPPGRQWLRRRRAAARAGRRCGMAHCAPAGAVSAKPPSSYFDSMWPAKPRTAPASERSGDVTPDRMPDLPPRERESITRAPAAEPRGAPQHTVAILKSGVVDGMGYTLYVDGSIEAELPQGTLRFASIDELRSHLEKNS